jgi:hypothetical protein
MDSATNDEVQVFVYTGPNGESPPKNVVRVQVDPSVTSIPYRAFDRREKLSEVELCEGLVEIGAWSFRECGHSITKIDIPTSLRRINDSAFGSSLRCHIRLHDGIESIGAAAFATCIFTNFRIPPLITVIPERILIHCKSLLSLELPENVIEIGDDAFYNCYCLRNVAFRPDVVFGDDVFNHHDGDDNEVELCTDLQLLFGSDLEIIRELMHRFDGLPIHSIVYYQSYYQGVLQRLLAAINMRSCQSRTLRSKLDPTGNQQDCLGMTPLHILACSSVHDLEVYRVIVEKYPTNLITKDRWGALPLLYTFWGAAPAEVIQFLLNSYQLLYPDHIFNWTMMVETMGRCDTPTENIESLLCAKQMHFPEQPLDWEYLLTEFARSSHQSLGGTPNQERLQFLFMYGMIEHVEALPFKVWRDCIKTRINTASFCDNLDNLHIINGIRAKVAHFEDEFSNVKETTTILELALWKLRMNENIIQEKATHCQKKVKHDESSMRRQCRITCGADVVIRHVLPYLITV